MVDDQRKLAPKWQQCEFSLTIRGGGLGFAVLQQRWGCALRYCHPKPSPWDICPLCPLQVHPWAGEGAAGTGLGRLGSGEKWEQWQRLPSPLLDLKARYGATWFCTSDVTGEDPQIVAAGAQHSVSPAVSLPVQDTAAAVLVLLYYSTGCPVRTGLPIRLW